MKISQALKRYSPQSKEEIALIIHVINCGENPAFLKLLIPEEPLILFAGLGDPLRIVIVMFYSSRDVRILSELVKILTFTLTVHWCSVDTPTMC